MRDALEFDTGWSHFLRRPDATQPQKGVELGMPSAAHPRYEANSSFLL